MPPSPPFDRLRQAVRSAADDPLSREAVLSVVGLDGVSSSLPAVWLRNAIDSAELAGAAMDVARLGFRDLGAAIRISMYLAGLRGPQRSPLVVRLADEWSAAVEVPAVRRMESSFARYLSPRRK